MSRKLGIPGYKGDITKEATESLFIELAQDSGGMGWVRHLCWGGHGTSLTAQPNMEQNEGGSASPSGQASSL